MKGLWITLIIVFAALVTAGLLIFSGNNQYSPDQTNDQRTQPGGVNGAPGNNTQTEPSSNENQPQTYAVSINSFAFSPYTLTVKAGDTVIWTNKDSASHTVTSDSGNEIDSSSLGKGVAYSHTFTQKGTFDYHCKFHSGMTGKVIVG